VRPIIKWPGGKTRELARLRGLFPSNMERFVEPFVGGGACLFDLEPQRAVINDRNQDLIDLYRAVARNDRTWRKALGDVIELWDDVACGWVDGVLDELVSWFLDERARLRCRKPSSKLAPTIACSSHPCQDWGVADAMSLAMSASIVSKARRVAALECRHDISFDGEKLEQHFETAIRSAVYTFMRDRVLGKSKARRGARFVFLREFCYGSMFRFNREGKFNIPYGGIAYNSKRFAAKVACVFTKARRALLVRTEILCEDFRDFFSARSSSWADETVVFLDPPYDSEFCNYARHTFGFGEQRDLAAIVADLRAHFIVVVKDTPAIRALYDEVLCSRRARSLPVFMESYGKTYGYNARGRNDRRVRHLLITSMS